MEKIRLTEFSSGGGCGCKIPPEELGEILREHRSSGEFGLLIGNSGGDDAAVWDMGGNQCLISTTDFFTPIVDDAYDFGRIAAANAISDIYAMGGRPVMAVSILAWPVDKIPVEIASEVLKGARDICSEAGIAIGGGHSIRNPEPVFGLAVTGLAEKKYVKRNNAVSPGDVLVITKPIGSGILTTAMKRRLLPEAQLKRLIGELVKLNRMGADLSVFPSVHAMTDITGFGLLGHLLEMVTDGNYTAVVDYAKVPLMDGVKEFAEQFIYTDNTMRNWKSYGESVSGVSGISLLTLCDPQTNGGLLLAVDPVNKQEVIDLLESRGQFFAEIGRIEDFSGTAICIE